VDPTIKKGETFLSSSEDKLPGALHCQSFIDFQRPLLKL